MTKRRASQKGFTLVEVLVALVIIGIISAGVISLSFSTVNTARSNNRSFNSLNNANNIQELWQYHIKLEDYEPNFDEFATDVLPLHYSATIGETVGKAIYTLDRDTVGNAFEMGMGTTCVLLFSSDWRQCDVGDDVTYAAVITYDTTLTIGFCFAAYDEVSSDVTLDTEEAFFTYPEEV